MDTKLAAPAFGALVLAAVAFGVHLGESAIAQINPLHFQGAALHPRDRGVVVDGNALVENGPRFAQLYGWAEGAEARTADCFDCAALAARDAYRDGGSPRFAVLETGWSGEIRPAAAEWLPETYAAEPEEEEAKDYEAQRAEVARYADYEIEAAPDPKQPPIEIASAED